MVDQITVILPFRVSAIIDCLIKLGIQPLHNINIIDKLTEEISITYENKHNVIRYALHIMVSPPLLYFPKLNGLCIIHKFIKWRNPIQGFWFPYLKFSILVLGMHEMPILICMYNTCKIIFCYVTWMFVSSHLHISLYSNFIDALCWRLS